MVAGKNNRLEVDFDKHPTALYLAICEGDWNAAVGTTKQDPIQAKTWVVRYDDNEPTSVLWRFLPLHSACARQPPDNVIEALLAANPEAASERDDQGMLPIHYACGNRASDTVVNMLLIANGRGVAEKDPQGGKLPIHHLCQWGTASVGTINMLLTLYPESIKVTDNNGSTPLDLAREGKYSGKSGILMALKRCALAGKMAPKSPFASKDIDDGDSVTVSSIVKGGSDEGVEVLANIAHVSDNQQTMNALMDKLTKCQAELSQEKESNNEHTKTIAQLKDANKDKENKITTLNGLLKKMKSGIEDKDAQLLKKAEKLSKLREDYARLTEELQNAKTEQQAPSEEAHSINENKSDGQLEELNKKLSSLTVESEALRKKADKSAMDYDGLKDKVAVYQAEIAALKAEISKVKKQSSEEKKALEEKLSQQKAEDRSINPAPSTDTIAELTKKSKAIKSLSNKLDIANKQCATLREKLDRERSEMAQNLRKYETTIDDLKAELDVNRPRVDELENQITEYEESTATLRAENNDLTARLRHAMEGKNAHDALSARVGAASVALSALAQKRDELAAATRKREENLKAASAEREKMILQMALLEEKLRAGSINEHEEMLKAVREQEEDIRAIMEKLAE